MADTDEVPYKEHLAWCKERALDYVNRGDVLNAWNSFLSDMNKHSGTRGHQFLMVGSQMMLSGHLNDPTAMRKFIEDFN